MGRCRSLHPPTVTSLFGALAGTRVYGPAFPCKAGVVTAPPRVGARCAAHPARLAAGACPVCGRDRCAADVAAFGSDGCDVCRTQQPTVRAAGRLEVGVRAGLAALAVAIAGGWVVTQHVNVHVMSLIAPALLGLAASWAATTAAGAGSSADRRMVLLIAAVAALVGTALGIRLFGRPLTPVRPLDSVGPPYLTALAGVLAWPLLAGPSRTDHRPRPEPTGEAQPSTTRSNR